MFLQNSTKNLILFYCIIISLTFAICSLQGEEVSRWADTVGNELWTLGRAITRFEELKQKYTFHNAKVGIKDPIELLSEIKKNIEIMVERKVDAIRAIQERAEQVAESFNYTNGSSFSYFSSKYSPEPTDKVALVNSSLAIIRRNRDMYRTLFLNNDTHFYNLAVNTTHSTVHVPANIYDRDFSVAPVIQWSEDLDEVFAKNYNEDPALSWQYFGSATGIMRHYPALRWTEKPENRIDLMQFDCRTRTWFIEAATCTKDVVILIDNSGSMEGIGRRIGAFTVKKILDTFSNNDYVNILNYNSTTNYLIPCFKDMLVQATKENINMFKHALDKLEPEEKTQLGPALEQAFDLLNSSWSKKHCDDAKNSCNQAIMIVTDGVNSNLSEIIMQHNYLNNGSDIRVRLFTYLIGKEVTNVPEIQWISCANRGYYTHVVSLEQVTASVIKYISVIARPLVLQAVDHPVSWTHSYTDITYDDENDIMINEPYRLLISAAIPCYDTKTNKRNDTRTAYLLGVAGTDVPLDEFEKLILPYKVGVNGYAFIVSNNGYVLMHPDLRPVFQGAVKEITDNYNSIDITLVQQHFAPDDEESGPREIVKSLLELREDLINKKNGSRHNIKLKYHYDNMTRVFESYYDYYFTRLNNTPFTIAIAIPQNYGNFALEVGDEIQRNKHTGVNLTSFFKGKWKVHPKWVYCKYHYLEGHEFSTPEDELLHFLERMYGQAFKWEKQYEAEKKKLNNDDYYCDMALVQRLIFDAKNTNDIFGENAVFDAKIKFEKYKVFVRFVATMSGLTRWNYIAESPKNESKTQPKEFGDFHPRAIGEKWYKNAVLQHHYDESFVYSVPAYDSYNISKDNDTIVTASFAIFPSDGGREAPGSVVGFQFSQSALMYHVLDIANKSSKQCQQSHFCGTCSDVLHCYVIDSSGYIIVSENQAETSKFFGEIEGDIMQSMLKEGIFKNITVYDYQALCLKESEDKNKNEEDFIVEVTGNSTSSAAAILMPIKYVEWTIKWFVTKLLYTLFELSYHNIHQAFVYAEEHLNDSYAYNVTNETVTNETDEIEEPEIIPKRDDYFSCENKFNLFVLQQNIFIKENFNGEINSHTRNYYIKRILHSNLYFVAINITGKKDFNPFYTTAPQRYTDEPVFTSNGINSLLPCQKLTLNNLPRRKLSGCYNQHKWEHEIIDCGARAASIHINKILFIATNIIFTLIILYGNN